MNDNDFDLIESNQPIDQPEGCRGGADILLGRQGDDSDQPTPDPVSGVYRSEEEKQEEPAAKSAAQPAVSAQENAPDPVSGVYRSEEEKQEEPAAKSAAQSAVSAQENAPDPVSGVYRSDEEKQEGSAAHNPFAEDSYEKRGAGLREYERMFEPSEPEHPLSTFTSEEICEKRFVREKYLIEGLLKPGLTVLAGSPKIGKSWLVLQLCMQVAKGEDFWGLKTHFSEVLYLALEDSMERLQKRVLTITSEPSPALHFAISCSSLAGEFTKELEHFLINHPITRLVVIDTFQMIRNQGMQMSYANDYSEVSRLKEIADRMKVCIVLVHHTRKMGDSDRFNEISGTNGIAGSADTLMVLTKEKRTARKATLSCTGRDVEDLELELVMDRNSCLWTCKTPISTFSDENELPDILMDLLDFVQKKGDYAALNKELKKALSDKIGEEVNIQQLNNYLAYYRYQLEDLGLRFEFVRTAQGRGVAMTYEEPLGANDLAF